MADRTPRLTPTELKVLNLIRAGFSSRDTGSRLTISERTVNFHLANIYDKLQVNNRIQAIRAAERLGILEVGA